MSHFTLTRQAKNDLKAIARFTEINWGLAQRNIYIKQFDDVFHMLAKTPTAGKNCSHIKYGYQKFPQGSHLIFYKIAQNNSIQIIRILHKSMDVTVKLSD